MYLDQLYQRCVNLMDKHEKHKVGPNEAAASVAVADEQTAEALSTSEWSLREVIAQVADGSQN